MGNVLVPGVPFLSTSRNPANVTC